MYWPKSRTLTDSQTGQLCWLVPELAYFAEPQTLTTGHLCWPVLEMDELWFHSSEYINKATSLNGWTMLLQKIGEYCIITIGAVVAYHNTSCHFSAMKSRWSTSLRLHKLNIGWLCMYCSLLLLHLVTVSITVHVTDQFQKPVHEWVDHVHMPKVCSFSWSG